jgi:tRNA U38,U39,U40 pseudouridine synthase TruA
VSDFVVLAQETDSFIKDKGKLHGLMIYARKFPGWNDFGGLLSRLKFVRSHERFIRRIATVSDSAILTITAQIAAHFIHAEVRRFDFDDRDAALAWLGGE